MSRSVNPTVLIDEMRSIGESMHDKGMIEFDLSNGEITWCNQYASEKMGYDGIQSTSASIFSIIPSEFHGQLKKHISNIVMHRGLGFSIWPTTTTSEEIVWWYIYQTRTQYPIRWSYLEFIQITDIHGIAYAFMRMQMDTVNKYGDLSIKISELDQWVHERMEELSEKDSELEQSISEIKELIESFVETRDSIESFKDEIRGQYDALDKKTDDHTAEILKLIGSSVVQTKRMNAFEKHVKMTTDLAIRSLTLQTEKVGKGLPKKVAIPVSIVSILAAIIQYLIQNWAQGSLKWPF